MAIYRSMPYMYSNLNWKDLVQLKEKKFVLLLPIGSTEPHGPHAPLSTDTIISLEACLRAAKKLHNLEYEAYVLPPLCYSSTLASRSFPGHTSISASTFSSMVYDICLSLISHGMSKICLFNSHSEPPHIKAIYDAVERVFEDTGIQILFTDTTRKKYAVRLTEAYQKAETHADRYETSIVMAVDPSLVNEERRKKLPYLPINLVEKMFKEHIDEFKAMGLHEAYCGDPASASAEEGEEILNSLSDFIVEDVEALFRGETRRPERGLYAQHNKA